MSEHKSPYDIGRIFTEMTLNLIASLKRNLSRHKREEEKVGFKFDQWQLAKLRNIKDYRKANKQITDQAFKEADKLVDEVLRDSFNTGEQIVEQVVKKTVSGEISLPEDFKPPKPVEPEAVNTVKPSPSNTPQPKPVLPKASPETEFFRMNEKKLTVLQDSVKGDLKKAQHGVLRQMDDVYRQVIYKAEMHMTAGAKSLNQAIDLATKEFLEKGIDCITYSNGRRVTISAYAEMALRTASQRATFLGEGKKRNEWGIYTVIMSAHNNCSEPCMPYQGTVMIDDIYTMIGKEQALQLAKETGYVLLSEAMKNNAFHPYCRHTLATYIPGITQMPAPVDEKMAKLNYQAEQRQRYMERQIRRYKRLREGSLDEDNRKKYSAKVQEWTNHLKQHLEDNPQLRRDRYRE
ncbi:phage minor capsid protein [Paenibacillus sp. NAIST15-1]|uniref:phage minor capsid protein n=1 Tax=Paenibacillus sp. NAIST15-1 TaxID=1605994 RepID=UPI00086D06D9|nr:phage minor capsid protein [Paenibacillus sp. NAIST15-1]GAV13243.1 phage minor capsid protein [Paenibacillus sp. NAIST15-1]